MPEIVRCPDCKKETYAGIPACPHCKGNLGQPKRQKKEMWGDEDSEDHTFGYGPFELVRDIAGRKHRNHPVVMVIGGVAVVLFVLWEFWD